MKKLNRENEVWQEIRKIFSGFPETVNHHNLTKEVEGMASDDDRKATIHYDKLREKI